MGAGCSFHRFPTSFTSSVEASAILCVYVQTADGTVNACGSTPSECGMGAGVYQLGQHTRSAYGW